MLTWKEVINFAVKGNPNPDRKVEKREDITTSAGTFNCIVISQTISTKMMVRIKASSKECYAENVGMVRSESYNKKGKLLGYSELTKFNN